MKKLHRFSYSKNIANFKTFHWVISSSINLLFLKCDSTTPSAVTPQPLFVTRSNMELCQPQQQSLTQRNRESQRAKLQNSSCENILVKMNILGLGLPNKRNLILMLVGIELEASLCFDSPLVLANFMNIGPNHRFYQTSSRTFLLDVWQNVFLLDVQQQKSSLSTGRPVDGANFFLQNFYSISPRNRQF